MLIVISNRLFCKIKRLNYSNQIRIFMMSSIYSGILNRIVKGTFFTQSAALINGHLIFKAECNVMFRFCLWDDTAIKRLNSCDAVSTSKILQKCNKRFVIILFLLFCKYIESQKTTYWKQFEPFLLVIKIVNFDVTWLVASKLLVDKLSALTNP